MTITVAGEKKEYKDGLTLPELLEAENVEMPEYVTVSVNEEFIDHDAFESHALKEGDEVDTKVIGVRDGKISLSIKALSDNGRKSDDSAPRAGRPERVKIPKAEKIGTSLGDLMKDIQL